MMKTKYLFTGGLILLAISYLLVFAVSSDLANKITKEDGFLESLAPVFYFFASVLTAILYFKAKKNREYIFKRNRNIFLLLLALFLFICAGEEISWGQRIFGIETPELIQEANAQKELNLHNLWFFHGYDKDDNLKRGFQRWISSAALYSYIWLLYCFLIPILNKYSLRFRNIFRKLYFPVIPIWIGILFFINFISCEVFEVLMTDNLLLPKRSIVEIKETYFALLYLIACLSLFYAYKPLENQT